MWTIKGNDDERHLSKRTNSHGTEKKKHRVFPGRTKKSRTLFKRTEGNEAKKGRLEAD